MSKPNNKWEKFPSTYFAAIYNIHLFNQIMFELKYIPKYNILKWFIGEKNYFNIALLNKFNSWYTEHQVLTIGSILHPYKDERISGIFLFHSTIPREYTD